MKCDLIREVSSFQGANNTYLYEGGTWSSVLNSGVSFKRGSTVHNPFTKAPPTHREDVYFSNPLYSREKVGLAGDGTRPSSEQDHYHTAMADHSVSSDSGQEVGGEGEGGQSKGCLAIVQDAFLGGQYSRQVSGISFPVK